jgi:hypothetical protein
LTPVGGDPVAAIPVVVATLATLIEPSLWRRFYTGATGPYALTAEAWRKIIAASEQ